MTGAGESRYPGHEARDGGPARPKARLWRALRAAVFLGLLSPLGAAGATRAAARPGNPECIEVWGEARYRNYGYDHIVHVSNHCGQQAICDVSSSTNPEPQRFTIPPGQEIEALTFRGSPSREFQPQADCKLVI
jgi:hypothetical protein